jgi:hypothetical protein
MVGKSTSHCPLCKSAISTEQADAVSGQLAARKQALSDRIDCLLKRHRIAQEKNERAVERSYDRGFAKGEKASRKELEWLRKMIFKRNNAKRPKAFLAKASELLRHLKKRFPHDGFQNLTNGIVQTVRQNKSEAGRIVYICREEYNWMDELDAGELIKPKEQYRAFAGIKVVTSDRNRSAGPGVFIVSQKLVSSFAAMVRQGVILVARQQESLVEKQKIMSQHGI